jgi:hypothetical protein
MLPDFICIGSQKAGTSWLFEALRQHPDVWLAPYKEVHFFDRAKRHPRLGSSQRARLEEEITVQIATGGDPAYLEYLQDLQAFEYRNLDWYRRVYSWKTPAGVVRGEITPSYLDLTEEQIVYAREILGQAKIILIIRSPFDRAASQLRMRAERAMVRDGLSISTESDWQLLYHSMKSGGGRGAYERGIALWEKYFGAENIVILPFGDIRSRPEDFIEQVESFLQIPHFRDYKGLSEQVHPTMKLDIPSSILDLLRMSVVDEDSFLKRRFGDEFVARIK